MSKSKKNKECAVADDDRTETSAGCGETEDAALVAQSIALPGDFHARPKEKLDGQYYEKELRKLQVELAKLQS